MADTTMNIPDYEQDLQILQEATDSISEPAKKTDAEQKLMKLRQEIITGSTEDQVRKNINALKKDLAIQSMPAIEVDKKIAIDSLQKTFEGFKNDPEGIKKALNLYIKEKDNMTPEGRTEALKTILKFYLFSRDMRLDLSEGRVSASKDGVKDAPITDILKTIPRDDLVYVTNLLIMTEYPQTKGDPIKIRDEICHSANIILTNTPADRDIVHGAKSLSALEKTWLLNYIIDKSSISLSEEKRRELAPVATKAHEERKKHRAELTKMTNAEWTSEDFKDPGVAFNKLLAKGGPMLILGGGLWLLLSCFGLDTTGEKGSFFMKLLAGVAGIGVTKATGAWDFVYNAIAGTPGTAGGKTGEAITKGVGSAWGQLEIWAGSLGSTIETAVLKYIKFKDYTFEYVNPKAGKEQRTLLEYPAGALYARIHDNRLTTDINKKLKPQKNGAESAMDEATKTSLKETIDDLYNKACTKWISENTGKTEVDFKKDFFDKPDQTVESLIKYVHAPEKNGSHKTATTPNSSPGSAPAEDFRSKTKELAKDYKDGWFQINKQPINKGGLEIVINNSSDVGTLKTKVGKWTVNPMLVSPDKEKAEVLLQSLKS